MRIAIDVSRANQGQRTGPAGYAWNVVRGIIRNFRTSEHQLCLLAPEDPLSEWGMLPVNVSWKKLWWVGPGWTKLRLPLHLYRARYDVFWEPTSVITCLSKQTCGVVTVHDLAFLEAPHVYDAKNLRRQHELLRFGVPHVTRCLAVSEYTKRQIIELVGLPADIVTVTPLAADEGMRPQPSGSVRTTLDRYGIRTPYIITAGCIEKKKGIIEIVEALAQLPADVQLVLAGRDGYGSDEVHRKIVELKLEQRVKFVGWVPDANLACLMSGATCYVSACRYEGFGIAVLNALACGCPVVAYRAGAVPETVGDAAVLVDPSGPESLVVGIQSILENEAERQRLSQAGILRAAEFSWQRTAELTKNVLEEVALDSSGRAV